MNDANLRQAERTYLNPDATKQPKVIGRDALTDEILTDDYQVFRDCEGNLFASEENALKYYGVEEVEDVETL